MLHALIDGQDRHVSRAPEPAVIEQRLQARQDPGRPIGAEVDAIDVVGARHMQQRFRDRLALVAEQHPCVRSENLFGS